MSAVWDFPQALRNLINIIVIEKRRNVKMAYIGIGPEEGTIVEDDRAYEYALERCLHGTPQDQRDFKELLIEWFYSGNWVRKEGHG